MDEPDRLIDRAWLARREGRYGDAERDLLQVIEITRRTMAGPALVRGIKALAHVARDLGQADRALSLSEDLGDWHREAGQLSEADRCLTEALALYRARPAPPDLDVANALRPTALLREAQGEGDAARALWIEARTLYHRAGVHPGVEECDRHLAPPTENPSPR
jgi:tetratricopeptide (TPR) repeat protein